MIFFGDLLDLMESNQEFIEIIKRSYLKLFKCSTEMSDEMFLTQVKKSSSYGSIIIAYSKTDNLEIDIVASAKLIIEPKITLYDKCIGHIEDMEICDRYKNGTLTNVLLDKVKAVAKSWDCIKLNICRPMSDKIKCEKSGFHQNLIQMSIDIDNKEESGIGHGNIGVFPLDPSCNHCMSIIQRNELLSIPDFQIVNKLNLFIFFISLNGKEEFNETEERNRVIDKLNTKELSNYRILIIVHVVDLMQKYKIASNDIVDFLYMSSISQYNGVEFEWKKDNDFLDKIFNEKIMRLYI